MYLFKHRHTSEKDEQKGFQFLFAGSVLAIRDPRGHEYNFVDSPDKCLDHLKSRVDATQETRGSGL